MVHSRISIDWLSHTHPGNNPCAYVPNPIYHIIELAQDEGHPPPRGIGYNQADWLSTGGVIRWHESRPQQRAMIEHSGRSCAALKAALTGAGLERWGAYAEYVLIVMRGRFTRADIALDLRDTGITVSQFVRWREQSLIGYGYRYHERIQSSGRGDTLYLGARASERRLRVYNKAAQLGEDGDWIRVEAQFRGMWAQQFGDYLLQDDAEAMSGAIRAAMGGYVPPDIQKYLDIALPIPAPRHEGDSNSLKWIREVVYKSLLRHGYENPEVLEIVRDIERRLSGYWGV